MELRKTFLIVFVMLALSGIVFAGGAREEQVIDEDCIPGELDSRYCDRTGNLVADPPLDESQWLDPDTLIFAYAPVEDPAVYEEVFAEFIEHLENELARPVRWFGVRTYAAQIEAMRAGRLHISGFSAGSVQSAVNEGGFVPQTIMGNENGFVGYRMEIISHVDSGILTPADLRGREIAFVSESSNSGYFAPRAILYEEFGMLPGDGYSTTFSGSHDNSILGVFNQDYEAAAIADTVAVRMFEGGRLSTLDDFHSVYASGLFPTTAYGVAHNLHPELQERIKQAFLSFDWEGTLLDQEWEAEDRFLEVDYVRDFEVMRIVRSGSNTVAEILGD
jgi:phosphonate transport system substrate-binding protein